MNLPPTPAQSETPSVPRPVSRVRWAIHLLLIGAYPVFIGLAARAGDATRSPALSGDAKGLLSACAFELLVFGIVFGLAWFASRASPDDLRLRWRTGVWTVPLGVTYSVGIRVALGVFLVGIGTIVVGTGITTSCGLQEFFLANRPDVEAVVDVSAMRENPLYFWLTITLVSFVVAGLREELWRAGFLVALRVLWPNRFGSRAGQIGAVAIAAVIFGFGHLPQGVLAVVLTGFLGFVLGVIIVLHRSIWPAVIAHGMFDATSLALLPWATDQLQELQKTIGH